MSRIAKLYCNKMKVYYGITLTAVEGLRAVKQCNPNVLPDVDEKDIDVWINMCQYIPYSIAKGVFLQASHIDGQFFLGCTVPLLASQLFKKISSVNECLDKSPTKIVDELIQYLNLDHYDASFYVGSPRGRHAENVSTKVKIT